MFSFFPVRDRLSVKKKLQRLFAVPLTMKHSLIDFVKWRTKKFNFLNVFTKLCRFQIFDRSHHENESMSAALTKITHYQQKENAVFAFDFK